MNNKLNYKKYPLKINLTIWYMIILLFVLIFFSSILYFYLEDQLEAEVKNILQLEILNFKKEIENIYNSSNNLLTNAMSNNSIKIVLYSKDKKIVDENLKEEAILKSIPKNINYRDDFKIIRYQGNKLALIVKPYYRQSQKNEETGYLMLLYPMVKEEIMLENILLILIVMIPITLVLASGGGYFLSNRALKAIATISTTAEKISQSNLSRRISISAKREDEIGRLIKTLNNLFDRLEKSFYQQKQFNADVSHELRTPISVIRAQIEEALDSEENLKPEQKNILLTIKKQIDQMNDLISQMLLLAKTDKENFKVDKEEFDLKIVIDTVIEEMNNLAFEKNISIKKEIISNKNFKIKADLSLITQLLLNLVDNAIKYTKSNGKIKIILTNLDNFYKIDIIDDGIGIAEEDLNNIFKRFYRVDKSRSREYGGTGLGLSICSWIVKIHGGKIKVESSLENGSDFSILLPKE